MTKPIFHSLRVAQRQEHRRERCRYGSPERWRRRLYVETYPDAAPWHLWIHSYTETDDTKEKRDVCHMTRRKRKIPGARRWHHRHPQIWAGVRRPQRVAGLNLSIPYSDGLSIGRPFSRKCKIGGGRRAKETNGYYKSKLECRLFYSCREIGGM